MQDVLSQMEERELAYLQMTPPLWMPNDLLMNQVSSLADLYTKGKVVWAAIVQANATLFDEKQLYSNPAMVIYDPKGLASIDHLYDAAHKLFELKNTTPDDSELAEHAERITKERRRDVMHVPLSVSEYSLRTKAIFIWCPHLPDGVLRYGHFPILLLDDEATLLPARFWKDTDLYKNWVAESGIDMSSAFYSLNINNNIWGEYSEYFVPKREELKGFAENPIPFKRGEVSTQSLSFMAECKKKIIEASFPTNEPEIEPNVEVEQETNESSVVKPRKSMKDKILSAIAVIGILAFIFLYFSNSLDPVESIKEYEVNGKTYAQVLAESGRCENPQWVQETPEITWQDRSRSDTLRVSATCYSKSKGKAESAEMNVEEKVIFNLQYLKMGSGKKKHAKYHVDAGVEYYILTVDGKEKSKEFHPSLSKIFSNPLVIRD